MAEDIKVPNLGESISEATVGKWLKSEGESVEADEAVLELETDKVAMEVNAPVAGVLAKQAVGEGDTVAVGDVLGQIDKDAKASAKPASDKQKQPEEKEEKEEKEAPKAEDNKTSAQKDMPMSPAVRKLVSEHDIDPSKIKGSGKDGRLTKADVQEAIKSGAAKASKGQEEKKKAEVQSEETREERVPMSRLRKRIAERLKEAQNTAAMLTTFNEADMTAVMEARKTYRDLFEKKHGVRLGFMSFFVKACIQALREIPAVNAEIDGDDIVYKNHYDIGVAVSTPNGLVVPVVRDADRMSFAELEKKINDLGLRARDGKLSLDELQGGTFTLSNGGVFGSLMSAPILNPPQSGILGMHKIQERPVAMNGDVVIRPMMYLALSYDHRIIDGREAVTFLVRVKECLEDPSRLMLDL